MMRSLATNRFFLIVSILAGIFTAAFAVQTWYLLGEEREYASVDGAAVTVYVGEMYFRQADSDLPRNTLAARVGDTIAFYNEGSVPHTVTIEEYNFDEILNPGESTVLVLDKAVDETLVNCRFHIGHEAVLTVIESGEDIPEYGTGDYPIRSPSDRIERLDYELVNGVKEFHLTADPVLWGYAAGKAIESWGYNGQLPGPEIRVTEGDEVRIVFMNNLSVPTTIHWHGVDVPFAQDGVPGVTQDPIEPGETFIYEFAATPAGTRFYHTHGSHHGDESLQMDMGLAGPLIIEPNAYEEPDREYTLVLTERTREGIFPINGRIYPNPEQLFVSEGDLVRVRMINAGSSTFHPMHLHGHQFEVVAIDGNPVPFAARQLRNTQTVHPGETYDIEFVADNPGIWLFHCHELQHAGGGMIALVVYEEFLE